MVIDVVMVDIVVGTLVVVVARVVEVKADVVVVARVVEVRGDVGGNLSVITTDTQGLYSIGNLTPGVIRISAWKENYSMVQKTINLSSGTTVTIDFGLEFTNETTTLPTTTSSTINPPTTTSLETTTTILEETSTTFDVTTTTRVPPKISLDLSAPKYVQPGDDFELEVRITVSNADSGKLTNTLNYPDDFVIKPTGRWSVASIKEGDTKELTRNVTIGKNAVEGERIITGEILNDSGGVISFDQVIVNVKKPYVINLAPNVTVEIPRIEVIQERVFYSVNKFINTVVKSTALSLILLLILIGLFYVYYRFRGTDRASKASEGRGQDDSSAGT